MRQKLLKYLLNDRGISLLETLVTLVLLSVLAILSAPLIKSSEPFNFRVDRIASQLRLSRARAISQTTAYRVMASSNNQFVIDKANSCSATTWTRDSYFQSEDLRLSSAREVSSGEGARLTQARVNNTLASPVTNWSICYDSRGITSTDLLLTFQDLTTSEIIRIQVFAGGALQVYGN
jgi:type IV fimbrial biogenesis protein FimT